MCTGHHSFQHLYGLDSGEDVGEIKVLIEESEPLGLQVSWVKTKIQDFNDVLDAAILSVPVCGDDVEVTERFAFLSFFLCIHCRGSYES